VAGRGAVLGAEHDHVGALALGQAAQAVSGRSAEDDVAGGVGTAQRLRAGLEQALGLLLGGALAGGVGLGGVTHVGELELGAGVSEQAAEDERVLVVRCPVVGDDHLGSHCGSSGCADRAGGLVGASGLGTVMTAGRHHLYFV
jgi:hypothetical protein